MVGGLIALVAALAVGLGVVAGEGGVGRDEDGNGRRDERRGRRRREGEMTRRGPWSGEQWRRYSDRCCS